MVGPIGAIGGVGHPGHMLLSRCQTQTRQPFTLKLPLADQCVASMYLLEIFYGEKDNDSNDDNDDNFVDSYDDHDI